jgi:hypothetical protein
VQLVDNRIIWKRHVYVVEKTFTQLVAVNIIGDRFKYLLDTTAMRDNQNRLIPSGVFEIDGRLFLWRDKHRLITDSTLKILNKFHLVQRGTSGDIDKFLSFGTDDSKQAAAYFFCRNDFSKYKKIISSKAIGFYDPPNISCNR